MRFLALVLVALVGGGLVGRVQGEPPAEQGHESAKVRVISAPSAVPKWIGEPISLSLKEADLVEVVRSLARLSKLNVVIDPRVQGKVTVELEDVPWDQVLHVILKTHRLGMEVDGRIVSIAPTPR